MVKALYAAYFTGVAGQSIGLFYIGDGVLIGVDVGTMRYEGSYTTKPDGTLDGAIEYLIPPNTPLITGMPSAGGPTRIALKLSLPPHFDDGRIVTIETPLGPVNAKFEKLKDID